MFLPCINKVYVCMYVVQRYGKSAVKTTKKRIKKANKDGTDPWFAILDHRRHEKQPAKRLISRRTRTLLRTSEKLLKP